MTVSSTTRRAGPFIGNAVTVTFPFVFKIFATTDLSVSKLATATAVTTLLVLNVDYTAILNANQDANPGGSITLTAGALPVGYTLTITSAVENLQLTQLLNQGGFYPDVITTALDRLTILIQQIELLTKSMTAVPCVAIVVGSTYQAPGNVAAVFVNGNLQDPTAFSQDAVTFILTFNYALNAGDNVNALCTLL